MPVANGRTDRTEFIGPLSALPGVQKDERIKGIRYTFEDACFLVAVSFINFVIAEDLTTFT